MSIENLIQDTSSKNDLQEFIKRIVMKEEVSERDLLLHNSEENSVIALAKQYEGKLERGVLHFQRSFLADNFLDFFSTAIIDLCWIEKYFAEISRMHCLYRWDEENSFYQIFLTMRLSSNLIVDYGLLSHPEKKEEVLKLDLGLKGVTAIYDGEENRSLNAVMKQSEKICKIEQTEIKTIRKLTAQLLKSMHQEVAV